MTSKVADEYIQEAFNAEVGSFRSTVVGDASGYQNPDFWTAVGMNLVDGYSLFESYGTNPDISSGTAPEDVWNQGGLYTFSTGNLINSISSSNAADTQAIDILGFQNGGGYITQTATLNGTTKVTLDTPLYRVNQISNISAATLSGDVYLYEDDTTTITPGVPDTASKIRAKISLDGSTSSNTSDMCIFSVPFDKIGYFIGGYLNMTKTLNATATFSTRVSFGGYAQRVVSRMSLGTGSNPWWRHRLFGAVPLPPGTDLLYRCDTVSTQSVGVGGSFTIGLKDV